MTKHENALILIIYPTKTNKKRSKVKILKEKAGEHQTPVIFLFQARGTKLELCYQHKNEQLATLASDLQKIRKEIPAADYNNGARANKVTTEKNLFQ